MDFLNTGKHWILNHLARPIFTLLMSNEYIMTCTIHVTDGVSWTGQKYLPVVAVNYA